jgi:hypothetical protein
MILSLKQQSVRSLVSLEDLHLKGTGVELKPEQLVSELEAVRDALEDAQGLRQDAKDRSYRGLLTGPF